MRALRYAIALAGMLGIAPALVHAQYTPARLLGFKPSQPGVEYDTPTDPAAVAACKVESVTKTVGDQKKVIGYALRDGQGRLLRRLIDSNGKLTQRGEEKKPQIHLDQWSYYQNGFEVYRDSDSDDDEYVDECRWMNAGGTRIGTVRGGKVVAWKRISAEEASKVLVQAVVTNDAALLATVMATPDDLTAVGAPKAILDAVAEAAPRRAKDLAALKESLVGWDNKTVWQRFDGTMPHILPAEAGLKADLAVYENAFIFIGAANGQGDPMTFSYLQAPELIQVGETWKFVELPRAIDPKAPPTTVAEGGLRSALFRDGAPAGPAANPQLEKALAALAAYDKASTPAPDAPSRTVAEYFVGRAPLLNAIVKAAATEEDKLNYSKQIIDSIAQAYQTDVYPQAEGILAKYVAQGGKLGSYAAYRKVLAEYELALKAPGANEVAVQKEFVGKLEAFLNNHAKADEVPDVLYQLASLNEFNAEEDRAKTYYGRLAQEHPTTPSGKKAAGALKRLGLVGKAIELTGPGLDGKPVSTDEFKGKTLLIAFWTSGAEPFRRELEALNKVYQKHKAKGFEVLSVSLDSERDALVQFLKENTPPGSVIFEEGGMDSRLAEEFGVISLPTMFLVDPQGKVVSRNIRAAAELERYLDKRDAAVNTTGFTPRRK